LVSFLLALPPKPYMHASSLPRVLHAHLILDFTILFGEEYKPTIMQLTVTYDNL
jgi:hypothetical protein